MMRRSELARSAGCHSETVRFYEQRGLLPAPPRSRAGHRVYGREHARRLRFVVQARGLGFGLAEIRLLLRLADEGGGACAEARALASARLTAINRKMAELCELERQLKVMIARCNEGSSGSCPIIDVLGDQPQSEMASTPRSLTSC